MNRMELEEEELILLNSLGNLQLEIDVCRKPTAEMLAEKRNIEKMLTEVREAIAELIDEDVDVEKSRCYYEVVRLYAEHRKYSGAKAKEEFYKYHRQAFEELYDAKITDPSSVWTILLQKRM